MISRPSPDDLKPLHVGVPSAADELVQPEREEALASLIPASVGGQEKVREVLAATLGVDAAVGGKTIRGLESGQRTRIPCELAALLFEPEIALQPGRDRMGRERFVCRIRGDAPLDGGAQIGSAQAHVAVGDGPQGFGNDIAGIDSGAKQAACDGRNGGVPVVGRAFGGHRRRGADTEKILVEPLPDASDEHGDVGPLPPAVGVELVEDQEPESLGVFADRLVGLVEPRHDQLEHDVVGQQYVGRVLRDPIALLPGLLPGVASERDRLAAFAVTKPQILLQLLALAVSECVHGVDDDGGDALGGVAGAASPQHVVDNGDEVGERLAGAGAGGQDVVLEPSRDFDGVGLVPVQQEALAECVVRTLA